MWKWWDRIGPWKQILLICLAMTIYCMAIFFFVDLAFHYLRKGL